MYLCDLQSNVLCHIYVVCFILIVLSDIVPDPQIGHPETFDRERNKVVHVIVTIS